MQYIASHVDKYIPILSQCEGVLGLCVEHLHSHMCVFTRLINTQSVVQCMGTRQIHRKPYPLITMKTHSADYQFTSVAQAHTNLPPVPPVLVLQRADSAQTLPHKSVQCSAATQR